MAGKLEIRVVPKDSLPRPQTLSPDHNNRLNGQEVQTTVTTAAEQPKMIKLERTKSILKQTSKERNENQELVPQSPKREQISFAPEVFTNENNEKMKKRVSLEDAKDNDEEMRIERKEKLHSPPPLSVIVPKNQEAEDDENKKLSSKENEEEKEAVANKEAASDVEDSASSESRQNEQKLMDDAIKPESPKVSSLNGDGTKNSNVPLTETVVEQSLNDSQKQKAAQKSLLEKVKNNNSRPHSNGSESSSSVTHGQIDKCLRRVQNNSDEPEMKIEQRVQCSPSVDLTSNPAVTFVSSVSEQR